MNTPDSIPRIPHESLGTGIAHGPYQAAPQEILELYMAKHLARPEHEPHVSVDRKRADIESEWQYDQHSAAVMDALANNRINYLHAHFMLEKVLRPWFIGRRNPGE